MSNFLHDYNIITSGNEIPRIFHAWAGLSCLSHLSGPKVWADQGMYKIYPHMYVVLTGPPGGSKSTAMRFAQKIVSRFDHIAQAPASITKEMIIKTMGEPDSQCARAFKYLDKPVKYSQLSIFASEFINLINAGGNPNGMIDFFTDIWDRVDDGYKDATKNKGSFDIIRPYISILACMTDDTAKSLISQKIVSGGMTRRVIFVYGEEHTDAVPFPHVTEDQVAASLRCIKHGEHLKEVIGPFQWTPEAVRTYDSWYRTNHKRRHEEPDKILAQFLSTKREYVIKIAMLIKLAENPVKLILDTEALDHSIQLIDSVERGGSLLFEGSGRNPMSPVAMTIERALATAEKPINIKQLYLLHRADATIPEIDMIMESLVRIDKAVRLTQKLPDGATATFFCSPAMAQAIDMNQKAKLNKQP